MKQLGIVAVLTFSVVVMIFAFVKPNVGKGRDEVLVRTWIEKVEIFPESFKDSVKIEKDTLVKSEGTNLEEKTNKKQFKKVTKKEVMKVRPLRYSRSVQFEVLEEPKVVRVDTAKVIE